MRTEIALFNLNSFARFLFHIKKLLDRLDGSRYLTFYFHLFLGRFFLRVFCVAIWHLQNKKKNKNKNTVPTVALVTTDGTLSFFSSRLLLMLLIIRMYICIFIIFHTMPLHLKIFFRFDGKLLIIFFSYFFFTFRLTKYFAQNENIIFIVAITVFFFTIYNIFIS